MKANAMHPVLEDSTEEIKLNEAQLKAFKDPNARTLAMNGKGQIKGLVLNKATPVYIGGRLVDAARSPRNARRLAKKLAAKGKRS
jgi:hypothetical protein